MSLKRVVDSLAGEVGGVANLFVITTAAFACFAGTLVLLIAHESPRITPGTVVGLMFYSAIVTAAVFLAYGYLALNEQEIVTVALNAFTHLATTRETVLPENAHILRQEQGGEDDWCVERAGGYVRLVRSGDSPPPILDLTTHSNRACSNVRTDSDTDSTPQNLRVPLTLREKYMLEYLARHGVSQHVLARAVRASPSTVNKAVHEVRAQSTST